MQDIENGTAICDNYGKSRYKFKVRYPEGYLKVQHSFSPFFKRVVAHFDCSSGILFTLGS